MANKLTDTLLQDYTGRKIFEGDCVRMELDHVTFEWNALIVRHSGRFWVRSLHPDDQGQFDEVDLQKVHSDLEVLKTFDEAIETGKVVATNG